MTCYTSENQEKNACDHKRNSEAKSKNTYLNCCHMFSILFFTYRQKKAITDQFYKKTVKNIKVNSSSSTETDLSTDK